MGVASQFLLRFAAAPTREERKMTDTEWTRQTGYRPPHRRPGQIRCRIRLMIGIGQRRYVTRLSVSWRLTRSPGLIATLVFG